MKRIIYYIPFIMTAWIFLTSCGSSYTVAIETQEPAPFTFPDYVKRVLVVNNAVPQSPEHGVKFTLNKKEKDLSQALRMDTALWAAVVFLTKGIEEANYFEKILICNEALRLDDQWLSVNPISPEECDSLYEETGADAILSVDRVLFDLNQSITTAGEEYFGTPVYTFLALGAEAKLRCSVYLKGKAQPATVFSVSDSLFFNANIESDSLMIFKELPNNLLYHAGESIGWKTSTYFIPTWVTTDRLIYSGSDSRLREADKFFRKNNWKQAKALWQAQFDSRSKPQDKARLATNLAVVSEMEDQLDEAFKWAEQSKMYYNQTDKVKMEKEIQWIDQYIEILAKRLQNAFLLNVQLGSDSN